MVNSFQNHSFKFSRYDLITVLRYKQINKQHCMNGVFWLPKQTHLTCSVVYLTLNKRLVTGVP